MLQPTPSWKKEQFEALKTEQDSSGMQVKEWYTVLRSQIGHEEYRQYVHWLISERSYDLAGWDRIVPRLQQTDYGDPESAAKLEHYFVEIATAPPFSLGTHRGMTYTIDFHSTPTKMAIAAHECRKLLKEARSLPAIDIGHDNNPNDIAPPRYFCLRQSIMEEVQDKEHQTCIGPIYPARSPRNLSIRSDDNSHVSGEVRSPTKKRGRIISPPSSEEDEKGVIRLPCDEHPGLEDRTTVADSNRSRESPPATQRRRLISPSSSDEDKKGLVELTYDKLPCLEDSTMVAVDQSVSIYYTPFFYLGKLATRPEPGRRGRVRADYLVAVRVVDLSVWIIYDAWDDWWMEEMDQEYLDMAMHPHHLHDEEEGEPISQGPFRPLCDPTWARLPGYEGRVIIGKLANDIRTWSFDLSAGIHIVNQSGGVQDDREDDVVPVVICAQKTGDGKVVCPTPSSSYASTLGIVLPDLVHLLP
ncbi:MAG: hypothetical protein M1816_000129 [Peltula sp. TS41687]|nr:MAG: hypothetical protein M1816_000129 [Peltula sp. TS41687]